MSKSLVTLLSLTEVWVGALGLAAFLSIFWVLRGAPIGQSVKGEEDEDAPSSGYRDRVVTAVTVGMLLILAGAYIAITRGPEWSLPAFVLGFGTVLALAMINRRYRHGSPTMRRTVDLSTAALNASLFAGVLIIVNVIAFRYGGRALDLTGEKSYSLSSLSVAQVKSLKRPVTLTTFFGRSPVAAQQHDRVRELLELYKAVNPAMIRLDDVNPYTDLTRYEALTRRVPDVEVTVAQGGGLIVEYGEGETADRLVLRNVDLFEVPQEQRFDPSGERFQSQFKGEDALTTALIRLREAKKPKIVVTTGHGEPSLEANGTDRTGSGMGVWRARLEATGLEVVPVNLLVEEIPDDAALIVIAGPKQPFRPEEALRLKAYTDRKGPLLVLVGETETTGLEALLKGFNVEVGKGFIVEPKMNYRGKADALVVGVSRQQHPILDPLHDMGLLFMRASPLTLLGERQPAPGAGGFVAFPLLQTSAQSWAEPDIRTTTVKRDRDDPPGPLTVGIAVNERSRPGEPPGPARLVVFSSRYLADNLSVQIAPQNLDLVMNAVNWLRGRDELTGIRPKVHDSLTLTADPLVRARLVLVPTVMSVLLILTFGVVTYLSRRD